MSDGIVVGQANHGIETERQKGPRLWRREGKRKARIGQNGTRFGILSFKNLNNLRITHISIVPTKIVLSSEAESR
jgi:hypothetical protein